MGKKRGGCWWLEKRNVPAAAEGFSGASVISSLRARFGGRVASDSGLVSLIVLGIGR